MIFTPAQCLQSTKIDVQHTCGTANERMILSCGIMVSPLPRVLIPRTAPGICGRDCGFYMASSNAWFFSHIHKGLGNPNIQAGRVKQAAGFQQPFAPLHLHVAVVACFWKRSHNLFDLFSVLCREHKMSALQPAKPQKNARQAAEFRLKTAKVFWSKQSTSFLSLPASGESQFSIYIYVYVFISYVANACKCNAFAKVAR